MYRNKKKSVFYGGIFGVFLLFFPIYIGLAGVVGGEIVNPILPTNMEEVFTRIFDWLTTFVAGLAIVVLIIAGLIYIFSQGNEQKVTLAKNMMFTTVVGLAVILGSKTLLKELYNVLGKSSAAVVPGGTLDTAGVVERALTLLLSVLGMLGIISLIWGGIAYLTSAGDQKRMEVGKKQVIYSIIGLAISIGALIIVKQIDELLG